MVSALRVALLSATLLGLELAWTRILAAEFFYTFAWLVLSLAILGLGLGALALRALPEPIADRAAGPLLLLTGLAALAGPPLVFALDVDLSSVLRDGAMAVRFAAMLALLGGAFFFGGGALALLFRRDPRRIARLYAADLFGAALGVALALPLMNAIGTPAATWVIPIPALVAAALSLPGFWRLAPAALVVAATLLASGGEALLRRDREDRAPVIHTHWDAMGKVRIYEYDESFRGIEIDHAANSPVYAFDGNWDRPDSLRFEFGIDVGFLIERFDSCTFLSLGSGGGSEVLQALQAGGSEIHAVEVNPYVNRLMLDGELAEFSGHIYDDSRVTVATEDARTYVRAHPGRFDVILSSSSNTFAALASGAFAMAENYLFTTGAFRDYWNALSDDGFLVLEHQFYVPRLVAELMTALEGLGVENPEDRFAVYALPTMRREMILLSKRPLDDELRRFGHEELGVDLDETIRLVWPPPERHEGERIARLVREGWAAAAPDFEIDVSPCDDDRPFTAQLGQWRNFSSDQFDRLSPLQEVRGFPLAKMLVLIAITIVSAFVVPLLLLPYLGRGPRLRPSAWAYFFLLGAGFMMIEIALIQKYTFLVGPSALGIAVILLTMLVGAGIGSRLSARVGDRVPFFAIVIWLLLDVFVLRQVLDGLPALDLATRMLLAGGMVFPVAVFLGMPFPKGGLRVGAAIDWGFAVNGAASVVGSAVALALAFTAGFGPTLLVAGGLYVMAGGLLARTRGW